MVVVCVVLGVEEEHTFVSYRDRLSYCECGHASAIVVLVVHWCAINPSTS